jgi:hypothetical protein
VPSTRQVERARRKGGKHEERMRKRLRSLEIDLRSDLRAVERRMALLVTD